MLNHSVTFLDIPAEMEAVLVGSVTVVTVVIFADSWSLSSTPSGYHNGVMGRLEWVARQGTAKDMLLHS